MEIFYTDNTLYVNVDDRLNFSLMTKLRRKVYGILDQYAIRNVVLSILNDEHYDESLIDEFLLDYSSKYSGKIIVK